jgi:hypothetical protein
MYSFHGAWRGCRGVTTEILNALILWLKKKMGEAQHLVLRLSDETLLLYLGNEVETC